MVKKAVQRGRSKRGGEGVLCSVRRASKRRENKAGGLFQHPARREFRQVVIYSYPCVPWLLVMNAKTLARGYGLF